MAEIGGISLLAGILSVLTSIALPASETRSAVRAETEALQAAKAAPVKKAAKK